MIRAEPEREPRSRVSPSLEKREQHNFGETATKITTLGLSLSRHTKARRLQWQCWLQGAKAGGQVPAPIAAKIIEEILALDRGYDPRLQALAPAVGNFNFVESIDIRGTVVRAQPAAADEEAAELVPGPVEARKKVTNFKVKPDIRPEADAHRAPLRAQPVQREKRRSFFDFFRKKPKEEQPSRLPQQRSEEPQKKKRFLIF